MNKFKEHLYEAVLIWAASTLTIYFHLPDVYYLMAKYLSHAPPYQANYIERMWLP